jgi:hypothetical protein
MNRKYIYPDYTVFPFRIKKNQKKEFDKLCKDKGYSMTRRLCVLIQKDINGEIK